MLVTNAPEAAAGVGDTAAGAEAVQVGDFDSPFDLLLAALLTVTVSPPLTTVVLLPPYTGIVVAVTDVISPQLVLGCSELVSSISAPGAGDTSATVAASTSVSGLLPSSSSPPEVIVVSSVVT